jgi:hypothetical protein
MQGDLGAGIWQVSKDDEGAGLTPYYQCDLFNNQFLIDLPDCPRLLILDAQPAAAHCMRRPLCPSLSFGQQDHGKNHLQRTRRQRA